MTDADAAIAANTKKGVSGSRNAFFGWINVLDRVDRFKHVIAGLSLTQIDA